jgi:hypothetical protein
MSEAARSYPSIYSEEYQRIVDRVNHATTPVAYHKACQELLIFVDLHIDTIRAAYETRGNIRPYETGTMVYCKVEGHLVRNGRVYGHRLTEISGHPPKLEYYVQMFYEHTEPSDRDVAFLNADYVFDKAEDAFK